MASDTIGHYEQNAHGFAGKFLGLRFEDAHPDLVRHFPAAGPLAVADIGAGAGRDALAMAQMGHRVWAVEPSATLRQCGGAHTAGAAVTWLDDRLPGLLALRAQPQRFDFILCNGVWMHLTLPERSAALHAMAGLLTKGGRIYIKAFDGAGQSRPGRPVYPFSPQEFSGYAPRAELALAHQEEQKDLLGKADVRWFAVRLDRAG